MLSSDQPKLDLQNTAEKENTATDSLDSKKVAKIKHLKTKIFLLIVIFLIFLFTDNSIFEFRINYDSDAEIFDNQSFIYNQESLAEFRQKIRQQEKIIDNYYELLYRCFLAGDYSDKCSNMYSYIEFLKEIYFKNVDLYQKKWLLFILQLKPNFTYSPNI